jgi:hypothetical protein
MNTLHERVPAWPNVVGPKVHFMIRESNGGRIEFADDPRLEAVYVQK